MVKYLINLLNKIKSQVNYANEHQLSRKKPGHKNNCNYLYTRRNAAVTKFFFMCCKAHLTCREDYLHARDGLALWSAIRVEIEALSNDAVILVFEEHFRH